jgi:hypothetical protein
MSNYTVTTNFANKDSLPSGSSDKIIRGSEFTAEFTNISTAVNSKVDSTRVLTDVPESAVFTDTIYTKPTNEPISYITGLQTALDGKVDDSQVLTNVPSGAVFTDTVYTKPSSEPISYISGLQTALNGKVDDSQVLTNVPSGAVFTDTVYTKPTSEPISYITGLQTALDGKLADTSPTSTGTMTHTGHKQHREDETASTGFSYITFRSIQGTTTYGSIARNLNSIAYNTSSDYRLKENVSPVDNASSRIKALKPCRFNFIGSEHTVDGFIAHEAQEVVPESVTGDKDAVDVDGKPMYQGIDQSKLVPLLTAALQEALERIETLEATVNGGGIS